MTDVPVIDLRSITGADLRIRVFHVLEELAPGEAIELVLDDDADLLLRSANLYLRHRLGWEVSEAGDGGRRVRVRRQSGADAEGLSDCLTLDHQDADRTFARLLERLNAGDVEGAAPLLEAFSGALRRHIHAEDELLVPAFPGVLDDHPEAPVPAMQREHREILGMLAEMEALVGQGEEGLMELQVLGGILSGLLAKHEGREEQEIYPAWEAAAAGRADPAALVERVRAVLRDGPEASI